MTTAVRIIAAPLADEIRAEIMATAARFNALVGRPRPRPGRLGLLAPAEPEPWGLDDLEFLEGALKDPEMSVFLDAPDWLASEVSGHREALERGELGAFADEALPRRRTHAARMLGKAEANVTTAAQAWWTANRERWRPLPAAVLGLRRLGRVMRPRRRRAATRRSTVSGAGASSEGGGDPDADHAGARGKGGHRVGHAGQAGGPTPAAARGLR